MHRLSFGAKRPCEAQISTINDITIILDEGKQTDVILVHFSKTFNRVAHMRHAATSSLVGAQHKYESGIAYIL